VHERTAVAIISTITRFPIISPILLLRSGLNIPFYFGQNRTGSGDGTVKSPGFAGFIQYCSIVLKLHAYIPVNPFRKSNTEIQSLLLLKNYLSA